MIPPPVPTCRGTSMTPASFPRRQFLQAGTVGALNMAFPAMVSAGIEPDQPFGKEAAEKSCIFLWLCGGPSQRTVVSYCWHFNPGPASAFNSAHIATGGYLGAKHAPMFIGDTNNHPAMPRFRGPEDLFSPFDSERLEERRNLLQTQNSS